MVLFDKEYIFKGSHAEKVRILTAQFDNNKSAKLFNRNIDVYILAPIIGFLYGRKAERDDSINETTKIFTDQLNKEYIQLKYNYQLIMLLDNKNESCFNNRIDNAFRYFGTEQAKEDENLYEQYVLGGVDVLYEKLIEGASVSEEYVEKLYNFIDEINQRYNESVSTDSILELCRLAKS